MSLNEGLLKTWQDILAVNVITARFTDEGRCAMDVENEIISLYNEGKWTEIMDGYSTNPFLPWIWPRKSDLEFIGDCFRKENGKKLVSVGCGSGLLEWLISKSTGIEVSGIELDKSWWTSRYAKKMFIPVSFLEGADNCHESARSGDSILLFCYFNNGKAFVRYIQSFLGSCFIVIGPGPGKQHTYTVPGPFSLPGTVEEDWKLKYHKQIGDSMDYAAFYTRMKNV